MLFLVRRQNPSAFGELLLLLMYQIGANGTLENISKISIIPDSVWSIHILDWLPRFAQGIGGKKKTGNFKE